MSTHAPRLPIELQLAVLRFCPPAALAAAAQTSLAMLQLAAPLLYADVSVKSQNELARLFCARACPPYPDIDPYLALSQIHSLHIHQTINTDDDLPVVSLDRVPTSSALQLDCLTVTVETDEHWDACRPILQLLDPIHLRVEGQVFTTFYMDEFTWANVRTVDLVDAAVYPPIGRARTRADEAESELELSYTFTGAAHPFFFDRWTRAVEKELLSDGGSGTRRLKKMEVRVRTEQQRARVMDILDVEAISSAARAVVAVRVIP